MGEPEASRSLELLTSRLAASPPDVISCAKPPVGGLRFMTATGTLSDMLDSWWVATVPTNRLPVLILFHEPGLESWLEEVDVEIVVGVAGGEEGLYRGLPNVRTVVARDSPELVEQVIAAYGEWFTMAAPNETSAGPR